MSRGSVEAIRRAQEVLRRHGCDSVALGLEPAVAALERRADRPAFVRPDGSPDRRLTMFDRRAERPLARLVERMKESSAGP